MTSRSPLIAIVGATGTGKSQLAVSLAKRFGGEIINADALQMYDGLPITTNKISIEERKGIPHHLLGCISLEEETWTVGKFVQEASKIVEEIRARGKLPVVVGGTHYYIQALLFKENLVGTDEAEIGKKTTEHITVEEQEQKWPILAGTTAEMLAELQRVDPQIARKWHPDDTRKIRRSLEIYLRTGKKASEVYREQQVRKQDCISSHGRSNPTEVMEEPLPSPSNQRYHALTFWIHAEPSVLAARLSARVRRMIDAGLVQEIQSMRALSSQLQMTPSKSIDFNRGVWIAIGYKQFAAYFSALESVEADAKRLEALRKDAVERTRIATRQYAKTQVRWIRFKLLRELQDLGHAEHRSFYILDGTDVGQFAAQVQGMAIDLAERFLSGNELPDPTSTSALAEQVLRQSAVDLEERRRLEEGQEEQKEERECPVCGTILVNANDRKQHYGSNLHRHHVKRREKALEAEKERGFNGESVD